MPDAYQMLVTLRGSNPPIWRQIRVTADVTLADLHEALQAVMGWEDCHLYDFRIRQTRYGMPDPDGLLRTEDARGARLSEALPRVGRSFTYLYDFGDSWLHDILIEKIERNVPADQLPECTAGARACPPEDCGGVWGYAELLVALADPDHPDHETRTEWVGAWFDPERFDLEAANRRLHGG